MNETVDFGFSDIPLAEKKQRVGEVFSNVAAYYDRMNDFMSFGLHRVWKSTTALLLQVNPGMQVLDIASGSGDMAQRLAPRAGERNITMTDINADMLALARRRLPAARAILANGESLPFASGSFDRVIIAFGLRNVTQRQHLLNEIHRVLKIGGKYGILEFSPLGHFTQAQQFYLTRVLPQVGNCVANDSASYRYLGESILRFPPPEQLSAMLTTAGLPAARINKFAGGAVCLHHGDRLY
ncbi:MAG: ubiquinone/menaquinone biosynthesis methyltransferase [Proteobacteria bacterium]|nr:ubiquinone/menaquinone biosynthesis methyltransferase [Pseudomonadota bacterium]